MVLPTSMQGSIKDKRENSNNLFGSIKYQVASGANILKFVVGLFELTKQNTNKRLFIERQ